jgi:hypothetical protein
MGLMSEFVVTVDFDRPGTAGETIDISKLISKVPTAEVLAGDPACSVQVRVAPQYTERLKSAVAGLCLVDGYTDLDLYE